MKVKELQELLETLSPEMEVLIAVDDVLLPVCPCDSGPVDARFDGATGIVPIVVLSPCHCEEPEPIIDHNLN